MRKLSEIIRLDDSQVEKRLAVFASGIMHAHYEENDVDRVIGTWDKEFSWYGAGEAEYAGTRQEAEAYFQKYKAAIPRCRICEEEYDCLPIKEGIWQCNGKMWIKTVDGGKEIREHQRVSFLIIERNGELRCRHIHCSNPYAAMLDGEVFPEQMRQMEEIMDSSNTGSWRIELEKGKLPRMYGNRCMNRLIGVKPGVTPEEYYNAWYENIVPAYYDKVNRVVEEILSGRRSEVEYLWKHPECGIITVRCGGKLSANSSQRQVLQGYHQDVTEIRTLQKTVEKSKEIFSSLSNGYSVVTAVDLVEDTFEILKFEDGEGPEFLRNTNCYSELHNSFLEIYVYPADRERAYEFGNISGIKAKVREDNPYCELMVRMKRKDGKYYWTRMGQIFVEAHDQITSKILFVTSDVHEEYQKILEAKMKDKIYTASIDLSYQEIIKIDVTSNSFQAMKTDPSMSDIICYQDNYDALVEAVGVLIYPSDREKYFSVMSRKSIMDSLDKGETIRELSCRRLCLDGTYRWKNLSLVYIEQKWLDNVIVVGFLKDIDSWKSKEVQSTQLLEEALEHANKASRAKTDFLSRMSHDIRTPLNAIIGLTALAAVHAGNPGKIRDYLDKIALSGKTLLNLINEVLDMNKIESGTASLYEEHVSIGEIVAEVISISQPMAQKKKQHFTVDASEINHEELVADRNRLSQMLLNLVTNAVKYTQQNGSIQIIIRELASAVAGYGTYQFVVEDNGIGMTEDFQKVIFEPFIRAEDSRMSKIQGSGLGMSIVKNIVEMMNGTISIESRLGQGSRFTAEIPIKLGAISKDQPGHIRLENEPRCLPKEENQQFSFRGKKILLVEDNDLNREMMRELLSVVQIRVETAENGEEAVKMFEASAPGYYKAVLMDVQMPVMNGFEASAKIREMDRQDAADIPIIAMTANAFAEDIQKAKEAGMNEHIPKPVDIEYLVRRLQSYM